MNIDSNLMRQAKKHGQFLALTISFGICGGIVIVFQASWMSRVIAAVFLDGQGLPEVLPLLRLLLVAAVLRGVCVYAQERISYVAAARIKTHLRQALTRRLFQLGPAFTRGERTGELSATLMEGIENLTAYFSQFIPQLALAVILPLVILLVVLPQDLLSGLIFFLTIPLIPVFMILIGKNSEEKTREQMNTLNRLSAHLLDAVQGLPTLKIFGRSAEFAESVRQAGEEYRGTTMQVLRVTFLSALALELLGTLSTAVVAVSIGLRLLTGAIDYPTALFILILTPEVYLPLRTLGMRFHAAAAGISSARMIFAILERPTFGGSPIPSQNLTPAQGSSLKVDFQEIRFEGVSYTYPDAKEPTIKELNLEIRAGDQIALVGATGSGKSTLAGLLLCFFEPTRGRISVDGRPLEAIPAAEWRKLVTWVPQAPHIFYGSVAENLRIARPDASLAELETAARDAHLLEWVRSLPKGFDTPLGEGGSRMSGGQVQRLALARAMLKSSPLLILDEPTSHLDPGLEADLQESSSRLTAGRTVLTIAHRLATVYQADRILVLQNGQLVAEGNHALLLATSPDYLELVRTYAGDPPDGGPIGTIPILPGSPNPDLGRVE